MYIKFCRSYGEDKKEEVGRKLSPELCVELEGEKEKQTEGNTRLYRAGCLFLTIACLVLLLVIIILSMKLQSSSAVCSEREGTAPAEKKPSPFAPTCSHEECQALFPDIQHQRVGCRQCADGWLTFGTSCFYLSTFRLSWDESQRNCSSRGGALAVVSNRRVQSFLTAKGKMNYWIGLRNRETKWSWVDNTMLQESFWADSTSRGNCGILNSESPPEKNWEKASCEVYTYFICELRM